MRRGAPRRRLLVSLAVAGAALAVLVTLVAPRAPLVAQDADAGVASASPIEGVPLKMGRRVLSELRQLHHAMPRIVASTHVTQPDGAEDLVALYEYGDYDACVASAPTPREGRALCRDRLGEYGNCTHRGLAHVTIAATPRGRPAGTGGALVVAQRVDVEGACRVERVLRFERRDVDLDERAEIVLDLVTVDVEREFRSGVPMSRYTRVATLYRADLSTQLDVGSSSYGVTSAETSTESSAMRWSFVDVDHDGHPDVQREGFDYDDAGGCAPGPDGWFEPLVDEMECAGTLERLVRRFDPASDAYVAM